jgi:hypothetical protein
MTQKTQPNAGTPNGVKNAAMARAWTAWFNNKQTSSDEAALGESIDALLRRKLRDGVLQDDCRGFEADIRQNAAELLFAKFLAGNRRLIAATAAGEIEVIADQIDRSVFTALRYSQRKQRKLIARETQRRIMLEEAALTGMLPQPSASQPGLPKEAKMKLALAGLRLALKYGKISAKNAAIAEDVLLHSTSQAQIANAAEVSRSAISQRLKHTAAAVRTIITLGKEEL